jgi:CRP/FNR family transcriptional regulator
MMPNDSIAQRVFRIDAAPGSKPEPAAMDCSNCKVRTLCLPAELSPQELNQVEDRVAARIQVKRGAALFSHGDRFKNLYAVRTGFIKTRRTAEDGWTRVTGFHMAGDVVGLDAIASQAHVGDALAMEDADVCIMPFDMVERTGRQVGAFQRHLYRTMSREIVREGAMMMMAGMQAEQRIASFLMDLSGRLHARGFSRSELLLRMSREEIGSAVGLKLETVSRTFSKFAADGIVAVKQRNVHILDMNALRDAASPESRHCML